ncbi:MAG TPA: hypothetical protein VKG23_09165 [Thermoanaerobaculia bacterium]|nr:hypothetical protein [Thermoanaerobaculia bacterium]
MTVRFPATLGALVLALAAGPAPAQTPSAPPAPARTPAAPVAAAPAEKKPAPPSPEAIKEGRALLAKFIEGLGGTAKVRSVHDLWSRGMVTAKTEQGDLTMEIQTTMLFPDRIAQQVDAPSLRMTVVATPAGAFIIGGNETKDLPPAMSEELLRQVRRVPLLIAQRADDPKLVVAAAGSEKIGNVDTKILDVTYDGTSVRWFLDPATFHILRSTHTSNGPQGQATVVSDYSEYRDVSGFPVAFHLEVTTNGVKDQVLSLEECKINPGVEAKLFEKPIFPTPEPTTAAPPPATTPPPKKP